MSTPKVARLVAAGAPRAMFVRFLAIVALCSPDFVFGQAQQSNAELKQGLAHFRSGEFHEAIAKYSKAICHDPNMALAWLGRAMAQSERDWQAIVKAAGADWDVLVRPIERDVAEARRLNAKVKDAHARWAGPAAVADLEKFQKRIEFLADELRKRSLARSSAAQFPEALAELNRAIELMPESVQLRCARGLWHQRHGDPDEALREFREVERFYRALPVKPAGLATSYVNALLGRAEIHRDQGEYARALAAVNEASRRESRYYRPYLLRGEILNRIGEFDLALDDFDRGVGFSGLTNEVLYLQAVAYSGKNQPDMALVNLNEVIDNESDQERRTGSLVLRGKIYLAQNDLDRSMRDLDEAICQSPQLAGAYDLRGQVHVRKGDLATAQADFERARELQKKSSPRRERIMRPASSLILLTAMAAPAQDALNQGLTHFRAGNFDKAIASYSDAIRRDPKEAQAWLGRAMARYRRDEQAIRTSKGVAWDKTIHPIEDDYAEAIRLDRGVFDKYVDWARPDGAADRQQFE